MIHMDAVAVSSRVSSADNASDASCKATDHQRPARCAWFDRLNGYLNAPTEPGDGECLVAGKRVQGKDRLERDLCHPGRQESADGHCALPIPAWPTTGAAAPVSREPVVGAPLKPDFGLELISASPQKRAQHLARADAIAQVLQEWADEGPSQQAETAFNGCSSRRTSTPRMSRRRIVVDAILLHLMDRGRYMGLVGTI